MPALFIFPSETSLANSLNVNVETLEEPIRGLIQKKCITTFFAKIFANKTCSNTAFNTYVDLAITELETSGVFADLPAIKDPITQNSLSTSRLVQKVFTTVLMKTCFIKKSH